MQDMRQDQWALRYYGEIVEACRYSNYWNTYYMSESERLGYTSKAVFDKAYSSLCAELIKHEDESLVKTMKDEYQSWDKDQTVDLITRIKPFTFFRGTLR